MHTPGVKTIDELCAFLKVPAQKTVKTLVVDGADGRPVLLLLRGDHELNEIKAGKTGRGQDAGRVCVGGSDPRGIRRRSGFARARRLQAASSSPTARSAPMTDFVCGANEDGSPLHRRQLRARPAGTGACADIRNVVAGDPSPDGKGTLEICRGIEVGHIFQLRTKYSSAMNATFLDEAGKSQLMEMGCYGIGVSRIVAAAIEQNNDERGIIWPRAIAPFELAIVPIGIGKSAQVRETADQLYAELAAAGIDVLLDDRDERPGVMFADMELIGIPHRIVVGERGLKAGPGRISGPARQNRTGRRPCQTRSNS